MATVPAPCPCSSGLSYDKCCGPLHRDEIPAPTAERLMRSRYSAFVLLDEDYLLRTWHRSTRPASVPLDRRVQWLSLEIIGRTGGSVLVNRGTVEFRARWRRPGGATGVQHENSSFLRESGHWFYLGIG
ncbi:MAG: YchJ family metal-binding protein [Nakamurella sp.]